MNNLDQPVGFWYLSHMRAAKAHASLRIRAVSPDPSLRVHTTYGCRRRLRPNAGCLALLHIGSCRMALRMCEV